MPDELIDEVVTLVRKNGQKVPGIRAAVRPKLIFLPDDAVRIEEGDKLTRRLTNGAEEVFSVRDPGYVPKSGLLPAHYQVKVDRMSGPDEAGQGTTGPVYRLQDPGPDPVDRAPRPSGQVTTVSTREMFQALRKAIIEQVPRGETPGWIKAVDDMEGTVNTRDFTPAYRRFILQAADRIGLVTPFIPALTQLLS